MDSRKKKRLNNEVVYAALVRCRWCVNNPDSIMGNIRKLVNDTVHSASEFCSNPDPSVRWNIASRVASLG